MRMITVLLLVLAWRGESVRGNELTLYTYHDKAPYYHRGEEAMDTAERTIYEDFAEYLNARQDTYRVRVEFLPRIRLDRRLQRGTLNGAVIGVNPLWFNDREQTTYLWSAPFMMDKDVVIVRKGNAFPYEHPSDLIGKRLTLPRGLYWWGVTELIREGKIEAEETEQDLQNLQKVALDRADATITSILTFRRLLREHFPDGNLEYLPVPHDRFERKLLFPRNLEDVLRTLSPFLDGALENPAWLETLEHYGYQTGSE